MREIHGLKLVEEVNEEVDHYFKKVNRLKSSNVGLYFLVMVHHLDCRIVDYPL